ncbi:NAD(P)H-dependent oxidoreductase [Staphylococcus epidermidis]|uniref:flavodoxin family protein n=1 Tax=Staphylococcus epidermidis TaxID=1282 RepID=UPI002DBFCF0B|nr:NAD(P)H-dependent oxidoreductase [Staphylococcus epidermidis]MEB6269385.1 NAD(P)H-dependent oxidoreductase [Staphylococcus epidermidis]
MITCLFGSSRKDGNSMVALEYITNNIKYNFIYLYNSNIDKVQDNRHNEMSDTHSDDYEEIINNVIKSDIIIFLTPLYWYSMSASMKLFIDRWTETLRNSEIKDFKKNMSQKKYFIVIIGGDNPKVKSKPLVNQFKYIFEFMGINNYNFLIGEGVKPFDILDDKLFLNEINQLNVLLKKGDIHA